MNIDALLTKSRCKSTPLIIMQHLPRVGADRVRPALAETAELGRTLAGVFTSARHLSKRDKRQCIAASTVIESPTAPSVIQQKDRSNGASSPGKVLVLGLPYHIIALD